jgi:FkbM family methyltransferase
MDFNRNKQWIENECRKRSGSVYLGDSTLVCRSLCDYLVYADTSDGALVPCLALDGYWELWVTMAMARRIKSGWVCVDVGANYGYFTTMMAGLVGSSGRVLAIEANEHVCKYLQRTIQSSCLDSRTTIVNEIVGIPGTPSRLEISPFRISDGRAVLGDGKDARTAVGLKAVVDKWCGGWPQLNLIKIDIEGAEIDIWPDIAALKKAYPKLIICMELHPARYRD